MPYSAFVDAILLWGQFVVSQPTVWCTAEEGRSNPLPHFNLQETFYWMNLFILLPYCYIIPVMCVCACLYLLSYYLVCMPALQQLPRAKELHLYSQLCEDLPKWETMSEWYRDFQKNVLRGCYSPWREQTLNLVFYRWKMEQQNPHNLVFVLMRMREIQKKSLCIASNEHCLVEEDLIVSQRPQLMYFGEKVQRKVQLNMAERRIIRRILSYSKWAFVSNVVLVYNLHFKFIQMFYFHEYAQSFSAKRGHFWLGVLQYSL